MIRTVKIPLPPFPAAPDVYNRGNEQQFRRTVEQVFQMEPGRSETPKKISFGKFQPASNLVTWQNGLSYLTSGSVALADFSADTEIPAGSTIVRFRSRLYRNDAADSAAVQLYRIENDGDPSVEIGVTDHTTTGWVTVETTLATPEYVDEYAIFAYLTLEPTVAADDARFKWVEIDYY